MTQYLATVPRRRVPTRTGLRAGSAVSLALVAVLGATVSFSAAERQADLRHAVTTAEPLAVAAEDIYRDLSDADAASAETFLSAAQAGTAGEDRYAADLSRVSANLAAVDADTRGSALLRAAADELLAGLPVFTKLIVIGTALADARQNLPVGAAYLREASALLRDRLLPAAQQALKVESDRLKANRRLAVHLRAARSRDAAGGGRLRPVRQRRAGEDPRGRHVDRHLLALGRGPARAGAPAASAGVSARSDPTCYRDR